MGPEGAAEKLMPSPLRMIGKNANPITTATTLLGSIVRLRSPGGAPGIEAKSGRAMVDQVGRIMSARQ